MSIVNNLVDVNSELYVHPSDAVSLTLVSKVFDGSGYKSWKRAMLMALSAKNKTGLITGHCAKPADDSNLQSLWVRCNNLVSTWICNSVDPSIGESIMYFETAHEMWTDLEERFGQSNGIDLFNVQKKLCDAVQAPDSLSGYYTKMKKLWDESATIQVIPPCRCEAREAIKKFFEDQKPVQFLKGLDSDYKHSCHNLLMMRPLPTVSNAYGMLQQQESHSLLPQKTPQIGGEGSAFQTGGSYYQRSSQFNSNNGNNNQNFGQNFRQSSFGFGRGRGRGRSSLICDHCKRPGHHVSRCFKIVGYPSDNEAYKGKRTVNLAHSEGENAGNGALPAENSVKTTGVSSLSHEQQNELLGFLMKNAGQSAQQGKYAANLVTSNGAGSSDNVSGPFREEASGVW